MTERVVTVEEIEFLDREAIQTLGIPSIVLMENAGCAVAQKAVSLLAGQRDSCALVVCGVGNNAGDGFVAARHLINADVSVDVLWSGQVNKLKPDPLLNFQILEKTECPFFTYDDLLKGAIKIQSYHLVVDALFGVGLSREIEEPFTHVIERISQHARRVIAVDIPSGLDGTTGRLYGSCVKADCTVTFSFMKKGLLDGQGPDFSGAIDVVDIGIPKTFARHVLERRKAA